MVDFKVWDKVRHKTWGKDFGVGVVVRPNYYTYIVDVRFENYPNYMGDTDFHGCYESDLELVTETPMDVVDEYHKQQNQVYDPFKDQIGGGHYKSMNIQPVEFILANDLGFCEGNIIKYTCRYKQKGGVEDLKKVIHYAELLIKGLEDK